MTTLLRAELAQLFRHRIVALSALIVPLAFAAVLLLTRDNYSGSAAVAALQVAVMSGMGVYITATTALAARRQHLFLKRLRTTTLSPGAIVAAIVLPAVLVTFVQIAIVLALLAVVGTAPAHWLGVVAAVVLLNLVLSLFAVATSGITSSPDHAQVTTLPIFLIVVASAGWVIFTGWEEQAGLKRLTPGGSATELLMRSWNGLDDVATAVAIAAPALAWVVVGVVLAKSAFRWEPRT